MGETMIKAENTDAPQFLHIGFNVDRIQALLCGINSEHIGQIAGNGLENDLIQVVLCHQIPVIPKGLGGHVCGFRGNSSLTGRIGSISF